MNVLVEIVSLKKRKSIKPNQPKNQDSKNFSSRSTLSNPEILSSRSKLSNRKFCRKPIVFQVATNMAYNVGSYTQGRTAGDFLSSRKAARAERCTPKTTAAALDG